MGVGVTQNPRPEKTKVTTIPAGRFPPLTKSGRYFAPAEDPHKQNRLVWGNRRNPQLRRLTNALEYP